MRHEQEQVRKFMTKAQQKCPPAPKVPRRKVRELRIKLIAEELMELCEASNVNLSLDTCADVCAVDANECMPRNKLKTLEGVYDAVIDLLVVVIGTGIAYGLELNDGWEEVHKTNMAKFGPGGRRRADGKWLKPPNWQPPKLREIIEALIAKAEKRQMPN